MQEPSVRQSKRAPATNTNPLRTSVWERCGTVQLKSGNNVCWHHRWNDLLHIRHISVTARTCTQFCNNSYRQWCSAGISGDCSIGNYPGEFFGDVWGECSAGCLFGGEFCAGLYYSWGNFSGNWLRWVTGSSCKITSLSVTCASLVNTHSDTHTYIHKYKDSFQPAEQKL